MSTRGWRIAGLILALAAAFALAALSRVPVAMEPGGDAMIRLSWRTASAFVEECRIVPPEELERLPLHMRRDRVCDGRLLPFRLHVVHNGDTVLDEWVRGAGAKQDRPLSVFHELRVPPGTHHVRVQWLPEPAASNGAVAADPNRVLREREAAPRPEPLVLETTLVLEPRDVALITYDGTSRRLVARGRGSATP